MIYKERLQRIRNGLEERRKDLSEELSVLPDGEFFAYSKDGVSRYYQRLPKIGNRKKERRLGIKKDPVTRNALVRKRYVVSAIATIDEDIEMIDEILVRYKPADENSIMEDFLIKYPDLADGIYYGHTSSDDWAAAFKEQSDYHAGQLTSTASDGTKRRSKGEILIGSKLEHYKIPYRYEAPAHPDLPYMPDFTIKRPTDGKIIYWEHLGKVNDEAYMKENKEKFERYEDYGIVPWDNLIITYDQRDGGISEKLIDALIHGWLL